MNKFKNFYGVLGILGTICAIGVLVTGDVLNDTTDAVHFWGIVIVSHILFRSNN